MKRATVHLGTLMTIAMLGTTQPVLGAEQEAIDGCIDQLRSVGGPDARAGGEVISSEFSEAATLVMLRDGGGTVWRCLAYSDGTVAELTVSNAADDGGGAMAGSSSSQKPVKSLKRVHFDRGMTGAELTGSLLPQQSQRYILGANEGQFLYVRVAANGPGMTYVIYNPDGSVLLDEVSASQEYRGQLWQSGDHFVDVYNMSNGSQSYSVIFGIQ